MSSYLYVKESLQAVAPVDDGRTGDHIPTHPVPIDSHPLSDQVGGGLAVCLVLTGIGGTHMQAAFTHPVQETAGRLRIELHLGHTVMVISVVRSRTVARSRHDGRRSRRGRGRHFR